MKCWQVVPHESLKWGIARRIQPGDVVQVINPLSAEYHKKGTVCNVTEAYVEVNDAKNSKVHVSVVSTVTQPTILYSLRCHHGFWRSTHRSLRWEAAKTGITEPHHTIVIRNLSIHGLWWRDVMRRKGCMEESGIIWAGISWLSNPALDLGCWRYMSITCGQRKFSSIFARTGENNL